MLYRIHDTKKYLIIQYNTKRLFNIFIILAICCIIYYLNNKIISILFVPIFLVSAYFFNRELIRKAEEIVEKKSKMSKKMIRIIIICFLIILVFIGGIICFNRFSSKPKEIQTIKADNTVVLNSEKTILFEDFGANDFTCTGFCYDTVDDAFWIGDYGALNPYDKPIPRLIEIDHDFKRIISEITLGEDLGSSVNFQGVAYDSKDNCLWLAIGSNVVEISKDGKVKNTIDIGQNTKYQSNGICYNEDDTLWILCGEQYLLHFSKDGVLLDQIFFNYKDQDHICIDNNTLYVTIGADYQGENNYVCKVNTIDGSIIALYQIKHAYSLEGISIVNNKIMIVNDGLYHSDVIGHSYIAIFDIPFTGTK